MYEVEKLEKLYNELNRIKELKKSLRRTTREQYYVLSLLIKHYEKEIYKYTQQYQLSA